MLFIAKSTWPLHASTTSYRNQVARTFVWADLPSGTSCLYPNHRFLCFGRCFICSTKNPDHKTVCNSTTSQLPKNVFFLYSRPSKTLITSPQSKTCQPFTSGFWGWNTFGSGKGSFPQVPHAPLLRLDSEEAWSGCIFEVDVSWCFYVRGLSEIFYLFKVVRSWLVQESIATKIMFLRKSRKPCTTIIEVTLVAHMLELLDLV